MITSHYHGPSATVRETRRVAEVQALADLPADARADIDAHLFRLRAIKGVSDATALEILAAIAIRCGGEHAGDATRPIGH